MRRVGILATVAAGLLLPGCVDGPVVPHSESYPVVFAAAEPGTEPALAVYVVLTGPAIQGLRPDPDSRAFVRQASASEWRVVALGPFKDGRVAEIEVLEGSDLGEVVLTIEQVALPDRSLADPADYVASIPTD